MLKMGPIFGKSSDFPKEFVFTGHGDVYISNNIQVHLLKIINTGDDYCLLRVNIKGTDNIICGQFPAKLADYVMENTDYYATIIGIVICNDNKHVIQYHLDKINTLSSDVLN